MNTPSLIRKLPLRFGIRPLDRLIDTEQDDYPKEPGTGSWTAAIVGPDGCGKSLLALHLASTYWYDTHADSTRIIYVSTDLSYEQALGQWSNFGLDRPAWRQETVLAAYDNRPRKLAKQAFDDSQLKLEKLRPVKSGPTPPELIELLEANSQSRKVFFFDLQADTAGDDWGFVSNLIGLLPTRKDAESHRKHLLIVDAVEGLEALVGNKDAFGQQRDRRSRVAQLIRLATTNGIHVAFIVEEPQAEARLPEQFVTDLVVRLRQQGEENYTQRTVEIEKCRAVAHVRGQHEFSIRHGRGTSNGKTVNLDDPSLPWLIHPDKLLFHTLHDDDVTLDRDYRPSPTKGSATQYLSHISVIPSLYCQNRTISEHRTPVAEPVGHPAFNLPALDRLFGDYQRTSVSKASSIAILVGETGTQKGRLARRYLSQSFRNDEQVIFNAASSGASVLLTTRSLDRKLLVDKLLCHLYSPGESLQSKERRELERRVFCHRVGARHLTSAAFVDILRRYIHEAQKVVFGFHNRSYEELARKYDVESRRKKSYRIRVVLEDWSILLATYPNLQREPLLLSTVVSLFRREGVSALIVSTQPGQPGVSVPTNAYELRNLDEPQILTWTVPFYGDRRVAITTNAGAAQTRATIICELESRADDERLTVNSHFDLYADVDVGRPHRVPLVVRLYFGNHAPGDTTDVDGQFARLFRDTFLQQFPAPAGLDVVRLEPFTEYDRFFTFSEVLDDSHLDHTLVFQIDEFWAVSRRMSLFNLDTYWRDAIVAKTYHMEKTGEKYNEYAEYSRSFAYEDPIGCYQPHHLWHETPKDNDGNEASLRTPIITTRRDAFAKIKPIKKPISTAKNDKLYGEVELSRRHFFLDAEDGGVSNQEGIPADRIPYLWDFGIVLADRDMWKRHVDIRVGLNQVKIGKIWSTLCKAGNTALQCKFKDSDPGEPPVDGYHKLAKVEWGLFLEACRKIASLENIPAFDVDLSTAETLSCLVLELWASIEREANQSDYERNFRPITRRGSESGVEKLPGLQQLLSCSGPALFQALIQIVYTSPQLRARNRIVFREHASERFVASREWYHTASAIMKKHENVHFVPLALPGTHAVRGDWNLAVASGSRSEVLAYRTIDLLSSRRNNLLRLQDGIGLPVRDILPDITIGEIPTALVCFCEDTGTSLPLNYGDVCSLGRHGRSESFSWLWRSRIVHYQRDCFYWRRWIARMIEEQRIWLPPQVHSNSTTLDRMLTSKFVEEWKKGTESDDNVKDAYQQFDRLRGIIDSTVLDNSASLEKR